MSEGTEKAKLWWRCGTTVVRDLALFSCTTGTADLVKILDVVIGHDPLLRN